MPDRRGDQPGTPDGIYRSAPSEPDDDFWLEQANKLMVESLLAVRAGASSLMVGIGALQSIYLGMLGFVKFVPDTAQLWMKTLFLAPVLCWMAGLFQCLKVAKTKELTVYRNSPTDIRMKLGELAKEKQRQLDFAYWWMVSGFISTFALLALRTRM